MKNYNTLYIDIATLQKWLTAIDLLATQSVLVQIFSGIDDTEVLQNIARTFQNALPNAVILGTSTSGEILDGAMHDESIAITLSSFASTQLRSCHFISSDSHSLGMSVAKSILADDTKAVIMFADGLKCTGEAILRGFRETAHKDIILAGGMAGDNSKFVKTFVMHGDEIFESGVVAVSLSGEKLAAFHSYNLAWRPIGRPMIVTKSEGNRVYEINNQPSIEIYKNYLGYDVVNNLPESAIEFPLIFEKNSLQIARVMLAYDQEGMIFAGEIPVGTEVRFGVASASEFEQGIKKLYQENYTTPTQGMFVYSCVARKAFLGRELESELQPLSKIAPISGFFTYGELYSSEQSCDMLNITTTVLGLSESTEVKHTANIELQQQKRVSLSTTALIHLIDKTINEVEKESIEKQNTIATLDQYQKAMNEAYIISKTDLNGNITFVNELFCKISGYDESELLGRPHSIVRHPNMSHEVYKGLWNTIQAKKIWRGVIQNRHKNGKSYYVDATIFPLLDKDANITAYVGLRDDITEIQLQKDKAEALLNTQESIVVLTSSIEKKATIKQLNQKFFDLFEYKDINDFLSKHSCICDLFVQRDDYLLARYEDKSWLDILLEEPEKSHLVIMHDKYKREVVFSVNAKEINLETENFVISTFTDVTELERARVLALSAEKTTSAFLATMSHELRTPLNAVIGFSQILMSKKDMPQESMKSFIEKIHISGKHLLGLVNNILDFTKIESKKMDLDKKTLDLDMLIDEVLTLIETSLNNKKIKLQKESFTTKEIYADAQLFKQLLLNILSNAVKFTPEDKTITLSYKEDSQSQIITICDEGIGMTQEQLTTIFEPFSQIKEHKNEAIKGTGLGLAISQKIAQLHNGKIEVQSESQKGSCFTIYLPRLKD
ncbi:MAG: FIST N-terminal domain-containing protein [Sulfurimonas sp.]|nr:FIST N-terminal domain-containing protein [Sulfurimonas sp.]